MGMIPLVADRFFSQLPELLAKFCQNGILLGTLTAVLLNLMFGGHQQAAATEGLAQRQAA